MALGTHDSVIIEITNLIDWHCSYIQGAIFTVLFCFSFTLKSSFVLVKIKQTVSGDHPFWILQHIITNLSSLRQWAVTIETEMQNWKRA